jgi:ABC-type nitrate/sulfonate/bicarbonate transport system substrate-binding protein
MQEKKNLRRFCHGCIGFVFLFMFWSPARGAELEKVRLAYPARSLSALHIQVAQKQGFFTKHGLQVEAIQMRPTISVAALLSGEVRYLASVGSAVRAAAVGAAIKVVAVSNLAPFFSLVVRPHFTDIRQLKGKEIGLTGNPGGTNDRTMRLILREAGLDPERDVKLIYAGDPPLLFSAFTSAGRFDAMFVSLPFPVLAEQKGYRVLINAAEKVEIPLSGLAVTTETLKTHREQVKRVVKAHVEAQRFIKSNKGATLDVMVGWLGLDRSIASRAYELYIPVVAQRATVAREGNRRVLEMEADSGVSLKISDVDRLVDATIAEEVNRELGLRTE